jgi:acylphosphatase
MHAVRVTVEGRVQGVGYRAHARAQGERLGLSGWVRNLDNGDVEAVAQGDREVVDAFVRWCHQGSPAAHVTAVRVEEVAEDVGLRGFVVRRG